MYAALGIKANIISTESVSSDPASNRFLISEYEPQLSAKPKATSGICPKAIVKMLTPIPAKDKDSF